MKHIDDIFVASRLSVAVQGALFGMLAFPLIAFAEDSDVTALTHPTNSVEIGGAYVSTNSAKFGEYNGLNKQNADLIGNFSLRGGNVYNSFEGGDGTRRWDINGTDLGTTSRAINGNVGDQGKWSVGIGYDELRHNISDTYHSPFIGAMGGNNFTLPANFGAINTATIQGSVNGVAYKSAPGANVLTPAQQAYLNGNATDVHTNRDNTTLNAKYIYDSNWNASFDYNHLKQTGAKLMGVAGDQINGITTGFAAAGQTPIVIMNPTNYTTDNLNAALNWAGDKAYASASYFGSFFRDANNGVSFSNPFVKTGASGALATQDTMSTMPSNDLHQLNLNGGYHFTPATKVVGGISYSRNTQNDSYANTGLVPAASIALQPASLNGLVLTTHADVKLTNQTTKDLLLSAGLKYNERDNQTASNRYMFHTINEALAAATGVSVNAPMSNKKTQLELAADYRIDNRQKINISYGYEEIKRWCNNALANSMQGTLNIPYNGPWAYSVAACAQVPDSKENKVAANYKFKANDDWNFSAGYGYSDRKSDINPSYYNPMQALGGGAAGEGFNVAGFLAYFQASRKEQLLKAGVNWKASEKWTLSANGRYTDDTYGAVYGVQKGNSWSINLDSTYSQNENSTVSAYATMQNSSRDMTNLQGAAATVVATATALYVPKGGTWTNKLKENDLTFGLGTKKGGYMDGKLEFNGDLSYSLSKSGYGTNFNYASQTLNGVLTCASPQFETCGNLPDIRTEIISLKLVGNYKVDKSSGIKVGYMLQHMRANDYFYNAYQYGSTPTTLLPTNQQAPNYTVHMISMSYMHNF